MGMETTNINARAHGAISPVPYAQVRQIPGATYGPGPAAYEPSVSFRKSLDVQHHMSFQAHSPTDNRLQKALSTSRIQYSSDPPSATTYSPTHKLILPRPQSAL